MTEREEFDFQQKSKELFLVYLDPAISWNQTAASRSSQPTNRKIQSLHPVSPGKNCNNEKNPDSSGR
ncbi:hypothetical protein NC651_020981 [Populus alba x Populus x berolinensis]|nr:hypothetical protein NC651_020981 [Populus alba x Populus x berolinensis]